MHIYPLGCSVKDYHFSNCEEFYIYRLSRISQDKFTTVNVKKKRSRSAVDA